MPYRCFHCDLLCRKSENPDCTEPANCNLQYVEVIHFVHPKGIGTLQSRGLRLGTESETVKEEHLDSLKLCCDSQAENPKTTPIEEGVTCLNCLEFISSLKE